MANVVGWAAFIGFVVTDDWHDLADFSANSVFQTVQYDASATIQLDTQRYRSFMAEQTLQNQLCDASRNVVKSILPKFGSNTFGSACAALAADGSLILTAQATSPENAQAAADYTAQKLIQHIRAAGGRDSLRRLMEYELGLLLKNQPANDELGDACAN